MRTLSPATAAVFRPIELGDSDEFHLTVDPTFSTFVINAYRKFTGFFSNAKTQLTLPSPPAQKLFVRLPESKRILGSDLGPFVYDAPATDYTVEVLNELIASQGRLFFDDTESQIVFDWVLSQSKFADYCASVIAKYKEHHEVPTDHNLEWSATDPLAPYQQVGLYCASLSPGYGLWMEQGTGKTPVGIAYICNGAKRFAENNGSRMYRAIVVCPNNVRFNWQEEFYRFATQPGKLTVLRGTDLGRVKQLIEAFESDGESLYSVIVCGYKTLVASWPVLGQVEWDAAILDEAQEIRNPKTARFKTIMQLRDKSAQRLTLTGTPIWNSAIDLYALFEFHQRFGSGFSSFKKFKKHYGVYEIVGDGYEKLLGVTNLPFMQERMVRYTYQVTKKEALPDLPERTYDSYEVEMTSEQAAFYKDLATKLVIEIEADLCSDRIPRQLMANHVFTKLLRLAQITSGHVSWPAVYDDNGEVISERRIEYFYPNPKVEAVREILAEKGPDNKTIIWCCFRPDIEYLEHVLKQDGIDCVTYYGETSDADRKIAEHRFNCEPHCKVFIGTDAGGTGLNLLGYKPHHPDEYTTNADHTIFYSQNWSPRDQKADRNHRKGTRVPVRYTDLVVPRSVDEEIRAVVIGKRVHAMQVSDIRDMLKKVIQ